MQTSEARIAERSLHPSARWPRWPPRTSGDGAWAPPTWQNQRVPNTQAGPAQGAIMEVEQDDSTLPSISGLDTVAVALQDPATGIRYAT